MNIVFVSSEASPYCKSGGLGDVAGSLPAALSRQKNVNVSVFLPYYRTIKQNDEFEITNVCSFYVDLSWRHQYVGLYKAKTKEKNLNVFFIDNDYYFDREGLYGHSDDGERFAYFSYAVLEAVSRLGLDPEVIHCNDWQSALIPLLLHAKYHDRLGKAKTVFTIHNIEYQGKCDAYFLYDVLGLGNEYENTVLFDGCLNFMKTAILTSDAVTTVSETYARELCYPYYSHGLSGIITEHFFKFFGIVNGIDVSEFDPSKDVKIYKRYGISDRKEGKAENKAFLRKKLKLCETDGPLVGMVSRLVEHKGLDLVMPIMSELLSKGFQFVILGTGDPKYEDQLGYFEASHPGMLSLNFKFDQTLASQIYASSDLYLMPSKSEPCGLSQLIAMRYGTVPVVHTVGGLKDTVEAYDVTTKRGCGITFQSFSSGDLKDAMFRAKALYEKPEEFGIVINNAMNYDSSWDVSCKKYLELYTKITG